MVQAMIEISKNTNQVLNIVKARYNLKDKSQAIEKVVLKYGEEILEPELRPEFIQKIKQLEEKGKFTSYTHLSDLKRELEHA